MNVTPRAIWYVESHLHEETSLPVVAAAIGVSRFHLSRAFSVTTGSALAAYARARRLSEAAKVLANGAPDIFAVALDAGYGSHEAFTRAFTQQFETTPEQLRERGLGIVTLQEPMRMDEAATALAPPRIVKRDAFNVLGLTERYARTNAGIPAQWSRFMPHLERIQMMKPMVAYGVIVMVEDGRAFDYTAGVEVAQFPADVTALSRLVIPPHTYAVFDHKDHVSAIASTVKAIWNHGLTDAGREPADGPSFERYDERFDPRTGAGGLEIWVPVKVKS